MSWTNLDTARIYVYSPTICTKQGIMQHMQFNNTDLRGIDNVDPNIAVYGESLLVTSSDSPYTLFCPYLIWWISRMSCMEERSFLLELVAANLPFTYSCKPRPQVRFCRPQFQHNWTKTLTRAVSSVEALLISTNSASRKCKI